MSEHEGRYGQETHTSPDATDASSFDDLAKGLATGTLSRGRALRMLGAALVGGALASIPGVAWAAKPAGCPSGVKCGNNCCPHSSFVCSKGKCACPQGQSVCGGVCRNLATDVLNCGACGNACSTGQSCVGGTCTCPSGQELCAGTNTCVPSCDPTTGEVLVFDPDTGNCRCECPVDTELCNGQCLAVCATYEQRDPDTCQCEAVVCSGGQTFCDVRYPCGTGDVYCSCHFTTEGTHACVASGNLCVKQECESSIDCPAGSVCTKTCCTGNRCGPLCGTSSV